MVTLKAKELTVNIDDPGLKSDHGQIMDCLDALFEVTLDDSDVHEQVARVFEAMGGTEGFEVGKRSVRS